MCDSKSYVDFLRDDTGSVLPEMLLRDDVTGSTARAICAIIQARKGKAASQTLKKLLSTAPEHVCGCLNTPRRQQVHLIMWAKWCMQLRTPVFDRIVQALFDSCVDADITGGYADAVADILLTDADLVAAVCNVGATSDSFNVQDAVLALHNLFLKVMLRLNKVGAPPEFCGSKEELAIACLLWLPAVDIVQLWVCALLGDVPPIHATVAYWSQVKDVLTAYSKIALPDGIELADEASCALVGKLRAAWAADSEARSD